MLSLLKAKVVRGDKGYVPVFDQVSGNKVGQIYNDDPVWVVDLSKLSPEQQEQFQFSKHWQIFNQAGRPYYIQYPECWMEISHIELEAVIPEPAPAPEGGWVAYDLKIENGVLYLKPKEG